MLHAYIDESGDRGRGLAASDHFIMSASVVRDLNMPHLNAVLAQLRAELGKPVDSYLTWKNVRSHTERLHIASTLGKQNWLKVATVVACKRYLPTGQLSESQIYLYQLRFLLERLSWMGRKHKEVVGYTMAHIIRFKLADLRLYESRLREMETRIEWQWLEASGGRIDQPQKREELQLADLVASATGPAFNPDRFGNVETRYLIQLKERLYREKPSSDVASYGLKMHPWNLTTKVAYPWIATL